MSGVEQRAGPAHRLAAIAAAAVIALLCAYAYFPAARSVEEAKDFFDSFVAWYAVRGSQTGFFFNYDHIAQNIFDGVPINTLSLSDFNIGVALFNFFDVATAYALNRVLIHAIAFLGMLVLVRDHVFQRKGAATLYGTVAGFCFSVIPHQFWLMGTCAGLPLALWGYLNIWRGRRDFVSVAPLLFYPFYAYAAYGALQIYGLAVVATAFAGFGNRRNFLALLLLTVLLILAFLLAESRLIYHWFLASYDYVSHRSVGLHGSGSVDVAAQFVRRFLFGADSPFPPYHYPLVMVAMVAGIFAGGINWFRARERFADCRVLLVCLLLVTAILVVDLFVSVETRVYFMKTLFSLPFSLARSDAVVPVLWWVVFALSLALVAGSFGRLGRPTALILGLVTMVHASFQFPGMKYQLKDALNLPQHMGIRTAIATGLGLDRYVGNPVLGPLLGINAPMYTPKSPLGTKGPLSFARKHGEYRFAEYYQTAAMPLLKKALTSKLSLRPDQYKVLTVNLSSALAIVNGFHTLNAYVADYPLAKGVIFLRLFQGEFAKDGLPVPDAPGNLVESYVSRRSLSANGQSLNLALDTGLFRSLGGQAVFSFLTISNASDLGLEYLGLFGDIHVYTLRAS